MPASTKHPAGVTDNLIYSRGFPYGAPKVMLRGGATKQPEILALLKQLGFTYDGSIYAWTHYMDKRDFAALLIVLRDEYDCIVKPKASMDKNYVIDLDDPTLTEPKQQFLHEEL